MKPNIICVDDEKIVLQSIKKEISSALSDKLTVSICESGEEALELINEINSEKGEIPIIISDYIMPGMKGDEFLIKAHQILPMTIKILLTGQATLEGVGNAINNAGLYRYITKPWEAQDLILTVSEAFKSYYKNKVIINQHEQLVDINRNLEKTVSDKTAKLVESKEVIEDLMKKTLNGIINLFVNLISQSNQAVFQKTIRLKELSKAVLKHIKVEDTWEFEILALLSHIGCIGFDKENVEKFLKNSLKEYSEGDGIYGSNKIAFNLLNKIPHLENIALAIKYQNHNLEQHESTINQRVLYLYHYLKALNTFDNLVLCGKSNLEALEELRNNNKLYEKEILSALETAVLSLNADVSDEKGFKIVPIDIKYVKIGMEIGKNVVDQTGRTIAEAGEIINPNSISILSKYLKSLSVPEPLYIKVVE